MSSHVLIADQAFKYRKELESIFNLSFLNLSGDIKKFLIKTKRVIRSIESKLNTGWSDLDDDKKDVLVRFADIRRNPKFGFDSITSFPIALIIILFLFLTGNYKQFVDVMESLGTLMDLILSLSERDSIDYQANVRSALNEVSLGTGLGSALDGEQRRSRLRQISDSVYSEI